MRWALVLCFAFLGASLAKVTFPLLVLVPAAFPVIRWVSLGALREFLSSIALIVVPYFLVAAPFYAINWRAVVATTRSLTSAQTASVYGLGGGWDWTMSLQFVQQLSRLRVFASSWRDRDPAGIPTITNPRAAAWWVGLVSALLLPFAMVALSHSKIERYAYPGYVPLFALGGLGLAVLCTGLRRVTVTLLFIPITINPKQIRDTARPRHASSFVR